MNAHFAYRALLALTAAVVLAPATLLARPIAAQETKAPAIIKSSLRFTCSRFLRYWPEGRKEPIYGKWSWVPRGEFKLNGPIGGGSQIVMNIAKPDGSAWLSLPLQTPEIPEGEWAEIQMPTLDERKATTLPGLYPITIVLKNELQGTKTVLFFFFFDVKAIPTTMAMDAKQVPVTDFYVDHDWTLPIGYLEVNDKSDQEAPWVDIQLFLRGHQDTTKLAGYIFKDGKQVASTKVPTEGAVYQSPWNAYPPSGTGDPCWERVIFQFTKLRWFRDEEHRSANEYNTQLFLDKNPGIYELKVLRDGKLIRTTQFTIGPDGKLVDSPHSKHLNSRFKFLPVKVVPGSEPAASAAAYTKAFYGNPIPGYTAP